MSKQEIWAAIIESTMRNLGYCASTQDRELLPTSDAHGEDLGVECALCRIETNRLSTYASATSSRATTEGG